MEPMSKLFKHNSQNDFQMMMNDYFDAVLLDFDNAKEINAIKTAFSDFAKTKGKNKEKEKNRKQK
jgi:hypothetical protein